MDVTIKTKGIILRRERFLEDHSRVFIYTKDFGKIDLIARGTAKPLSKLAAHIEPLNICDLMVVKGKQYDYLGSCVSEQVFYNLKSHLDTSMVAGAIMHITDSLIKESEKDERIFFMLKQFLTILNDTAVISKNSLSILQTAFVFKLIAMLGYQPQLTTGIIGNKKIDSILAEQLTTLLKSKFHALSVVNFSDTTVKALSKTVEGYKIFLFD